ncbi:MAG: hypothetical protein ACRCUE_15125 [Bosea sp. (in: a-proteobacteria)]
MKKKKTEIAIVAAIVLALIGIGALVPVLADAQPFESNDAPIINQFGPVPAEAGGQIAAAEKWLLVWNPTSAAPAASPNDGVWMQDIVDGLGVNDRQCIVLIDALSITGACLHRLSVLCMSAGRDALIVGLGQATPFVLPITVPLYQPPLWKPVSSLHISALGAMPSAALGGGPARPWRSAARVIGEQGCW